MTPCPFCQLADNHDELLASNKYAVAFLDINPIRPGHVLIIPKHHEPDFFQLDDETHLDIMRLAKQIAKAQEQVFNPIKVGMLVAGMDVPHAHVHLIPMHDYHDVTSKQMLEGKVIRASDEELRESKDKLVQALDSAA